MLFKRAFAAYYVDLRSPGIADPTEAFATCREYLGSLREQLGPEEFMSRLDDETTHLAGQVEQDLRQRLRGQRPSARLHRSRGPAAGVLRVRACAT